MIDENTADKLSLIRTIDYLQHRMKIESEYEEMIRDLVIRFLEYEGGYIR